MGARLFYFITYGFFYLTLIMYKNPMRDILLFEVEVSLSNLLYVVYYVSVHALAIHYFLTAGANPGFVEIEDSDEVDESEMARKAIALKLMEHSPSGETDDSVEDWVDSSP